MMQMKGFAREKMLSMPHLVIIFLVALIVFGPEKLPELARNFGKVMAEFKRATGDLRAGFEEHMRELEREARVSEAKKQQTSPMPSAPIQQPAMAEPAAEPPVENKILPPTQEPTPEQTPAGSGSPDQTNSERITQKASHGDA